MPPLSLLPSSASPLGRQVALERVEHQRAVFFGPSTWVAPWYPSTYTRAHSPALTHRPMSSTSTERPNQASVAVARVTIAPLPSACETARSTGLTTACT